MSNTHISNKRLRILLLAIFVVVGIVLFFLLNNQLKKNEQQHLSLITERYQRAYNTIYSQHKRLATSIYSGVIGRFDIEILYKQLLTADKEKKDQLRQELLTKMLPRYAVLQETAGVRQLHFHLSDNESFLRLHRPKKFGDNLTGVRRSVEYVNREHVAIDGFEEGRIFNGYRFVFPVTTLDGRHLGSMEVSFGAEIFTAAMMDQYNVLSNFFIKQSVVNDMVFPDELKHAYSESHHPGYYFDKNVLEELKKRSNKDIEALKPDIAITDQTYTNAIGEKSISLYDATNNMVLTTIPVFDVRTGEMVAFMTVRSKDDLFIAEKQKFNLFLVLCLSLLGTILTVFYIQYSKTKSLKHTLRILQRERDMFAQGSVITFTWQNKEDWPVEQVSENVFDILGYSTEEFLDGSISYASLIYPEDLDRVMAEVTDASKSGAQNFIHGPYRLLSKEGEIIWVHESTMIVRDFKGNITHYLGYLVVITELINVKDKAIENHKQLDLIIEGAELSTWDWDVVTGKLLRNDRLAEMLGYTADEFELDISAWDALIHPDDRVAVTQAAMKSLEGNPPLYSMEYRLRCKSGKWHWVHGIGKVFYRNEKGDPLRALGIHIDINKQKETELQLVAAKNAAESANKVKSTFLSNMSHELRTPLNAILGYTQIFEDDKSLNVEQQNGVKVIHQAGEHLLMLINDILDISKIEAEKMELVPTEIQLSEFIHGIIGIITIRADRKDITFIYEPDEQLPVAIEADALRLRQVILNLLSNAVKFTQHGHCTLRVQTQAVAKNRSLLTITVEDSGVGIAAEMLEHVFEPFQQTGDRLQYSEGSGLGLSISRKLIQLMGSDIELISPVNKNPAAKEGGGSRFSFTIEVPVVDMINSSDVLHNTQRISKIAKDTEDAVPPHDIIEKLTQLIIIGDVNGLNEETEKLSGVDSGKYRLFCEQVEQMVDDLRLTELEEFLALHKKASAP